MDVEMPVLDGIEATKRLKAAGSRAHVLVRHQPRRRPARARALRAGATGFFLKDAAPNRLVEAIRVVATGDTLLAPPIAKRLVDIHLGETRTALFARFDVLTERERDVVRQLARGHSNAALALETRADRGDGQDARDPADDEARRHQPRPGRGARVRERLRPPWPYGGDRAVITRKDEPGPPFDGCRGTARTVRSRT